MHRHIRHSLAVQQHCAAIPQAAHIVIAAPAHSDCLITQSTEAIKLCNHRAGKIHSRLPEVTNQRSLAADVFNFPGGSYSLILSTTALEQPSFLSLSAEKIPRVRTL